MCLSAVSGYVPIITSLDGHEFLVQKRSARGARRWKLSTLLQVRFHDVLVPLLRIGGSGAQCHLYY